MPSKEYLMLRSAPFRDAACGGSSGQEARLEARTAAMQPSAPALFEFFTRSSAGMTIQHSKEIEK
jgi:hypothetical protein